MFNLNLSIIILNIFILIKKAHFDKIGVNFQNESLRINLKKNCQVKCDIDIKCKPGESLQFVNSSCCPECVTCGLCPILNYNICDVVNGFKPIKQEKTINECCDQITCISDDNEELTISIGDSSDENSQHKYHTNTPSIDKSFYQNLRPIDTFYSSKKDRLPTIESQDNDYSQENESDIEIYVDSYLDPPVKVDIKMCENISCSEEKYKYFKKSVKCPDDSSIFQLDEIEEKCCNVKFTCKCNRCDSKNKMIEWCKLAGTEFEAILVQKGENIPGKCCDSHICHSSNFSCNLNGVFHPHNSEWMLDSCTPCKCEMGHISCSKISCPYLDCEIKETKKSECCKTCSGECRNNLGQVFKANETWNEDDCITCTCINGKKNCITEHCSPVLCKNPIKKPGICCKTCEDNNEFQLQYLKYPPHCDSFLKCNLTTQCKFGFKLNGNRCPLCECEEHPIQKCSFHCDTDLTYIPLADKLCKCSEKCPINKCDLICKNGFKRNPNGCRICECDSCQNLSNGTFITEKSGEVWFEDSQCKSRQCLCKDSKSFCSLISCPPISNCSNPFFKKDNCNCPRCTDKIQESSLNILSNSTVCFSPKNGGVYTDNEIWYLDKCTKCTCSKGIVLCENLQCPVVACENPVFDLSQDQCCPYSCKEDNLKEFQFHKSFPIKKYWSCFDSKNQNRPHGSQWKENDCVHCTCNNGENKCYNYEKNCPRLNCQRPILKKGECCKYCIDFESIESPYVFIYNNFTTLAPSFTTNLTTSIIIYILSTMVLILLLLVILLLLKSIHKSTSNTSNSNCKLLDSSSIKNSKKNFMTENSIITENNLIGHKNKFSSFDRSKFSFPQNRNSNYETKNIQSPLLNGDIVYKNLQINNSESDSFLNEETSKSTLFTYSIDESNLKPMASLNKQNHMGTAIYYC